MQNIGLFLHIFLPFSLYFEWLAKVLFFLLPCTSFFCQPVEQIASALLSSSPSLLNTFHSIRARASCEYNANICEDAHW